MFFQDLLPWLLDKLEAVDADPHHSENERSGAAITIAEILGALSDPTLLQRVLFEEIKPRIFDSEGTPERRAGAFAVLESLCKIDAFESVAKESSVLLWILHGLKDPKYLVHERAWRAGQLLVQELGAMNSDYFANFLADAVLCFDSEPRTGESTSPKGMAIHIFRKLIEKVSEARR